MADRFPLILNTNSNQIQEIASGDNLDLTGSGIHNAGIITATTFSGPVVAGAGVSNITAGIGTYTDLRVGGDTTFSEDFVVTGNARVTGILTVGTSSIILNDSANTIKVGTALTLGHTQGLQFHTQNLHSAGFDVNQINASGIITSTGAVVNGDIDANGDLDVDGHTNLDNVSIAGVTTFHTRSLHIGIARFNETIVGTARTAIKLTCADESTDTTTYPLFVAATTGDQFPKTGTNLTFNSASGLLAATQLSGTLQTAAQPNITSVGTLSSLNVSGNAIIGGVLTYEDVTNIDSVGIITARSSIKLDADGSASSNFLSIGADDDLKIFHQSNVDKIESSANGFHIRQINGGDLHIHAGANTGSANNRLVARAGGKSELYYAGALKLSTETGGVNITGVCTATSFVGGGSGLTSLSGSVIASALSGQDISGLGNIGINATLTARNGVFNDNGGASPTVQISTDDQSPWAFQIKNDTYWNSTSNGLKIYQSNAGDVYTTVAGNGAYVNHYFQTINGGTTNNAIRIDTNRGVHLYYQNTPKISTTNNGVTLIGTIDVNDANVKLSNNGAQKLRIQSTHGYADIGAGNSSYFHFETDRANYYFNTQSSFNGNVLPYGSNRNLGSGSARWTNLYVSRIYQNAPVEYAVTSNTDAIIIQNSGGFKMCVGNGTSTGTVNFDARTWQTDKARLHKWTSPNLGGGSYGNYSEAWYDGGTYRHITSHGDGFKFDHNLLPDGSVNLGSSGARWTNIYTADLDLSNEAKGGNNVDGTWGSYTIQEGENDLFLINRRNGKKYKFNLTEVS